MQIQTRLLKFLWTGCCTPVAWGFIFSFLLAGSACAEMPEGQSIAFSTKGVDIYADGSLVQDGEKYALVYVNRKATFKGFLTGGQLADTTNNVLVFVKGLAKNGHCPQTNVHIIDGLLAVGGTFYVVLLDTRAPDGTVGGENIVRGYGVAGQTKGISAGMVFPASGVAAGNRPDGATQSGSVALLPSGIAKPVITGIEVVDGEVRIRFTNTRGDVYYALESKDGTGIWMKPGFDKYRKGAAKAKDEVVVTAPTEGDTKIFKVTVPAVN